MNSRLRHFPGSEPMFSSCSPTPAFPALQGLWAPPTRNDPKRCWTLLIPCSPRIQHHPLCCMEIAAAGPLRNMHLFAILSMIFPEFSIINLHIFIYCPLFSIISRNVSIVCKFPSTIFPAPFSHLVLHQHLAWNAPGPWEDSRTLDRSKRSWSLGPWWIAA